MPHTLHPSVGADESAFVHALEAALPEDAKAATAAERLPQGGVTCAGAAQRRDELRDSQR
eukprot:CAMPEP_0171090942 /NCGR_PEP_ID=MMETSP0766_2-20121228/32150_1 /TAXON_ID=439317 /ORGANISM="Gambierdiscus australes, Strain CAWD 149" /LENGTH=59 /DNA_ID=CAMNT_0011548989 /DNA_START=19 /DNA_END=198 /DNA_ORIENTATION=-